jgi:cation diffusion facilitator family transporter
VSTGGGRKAIFAAATANLGIAAAKFVGFLVTGASSMLAEAIHSVVDTTNQMLLLLGQKRARKAADVDHPFGYGRNRYFYAFLVALVLFTAGGLFSIYEGVHKLNLIEEGEGEVVSPGVAIAILLFAVVLESWSLRTALRESKPGRAGVTLWRYIRRAREPELPVVILEDTAALTGLMIALVAIVASAVTGDPTYDAYGTIAIGVLLVSVAVILVFETQSLLVGEGATREDTAHIVAAIEGGPDDSVDRVIHLKTLYLGPDELLVAAKVSVRHADSASDVTAAINSAEERLRTVVPVARVVYLEPDVFDVTRAQAGDAGPGTHSERTPYRGLREELLQEAEARDEPREEARDDTTDRDASEPT